MKTIIMQLTTKIKHNSDGKEIYWIVEITKIEDTLGPTP